MKLIIGNPKEGKTYQTEIDSEKSVAFVNRKIGDKVDATPVGLPGYSLQITGGSDKQGFPMRKNLHGAARKKVLISGGVGFNPKRHGLRRRKSLRGEVVSIDTEQLNTKVVEEGKKTIASLLGITGTEEAPKEEAKEVPKEDVKEEVKEEVKEVPKEEVKEVPKEEVPSEEKKEVPKEEVKEKAEDVHVEEKKEGAEEESKEVPAEEKNEAPAEEKNEAPAEEKNEAPAEEKKEISDDKK
ncbi:MAG: 30S ribosomal protein S6e [Candidatus Diapherotrites archaeon]|nr:30S ribosomal protein S6e [Candidatus Diapherotrites archaeon]